MRRQRPVCIRDRPSSTLLNWKGARLRGGEREGLRGKEGDRKNTTD